MYSQSGLKQVSIESYKRLVLMGMGMGMCSSIFACVAVTQNNSLGKSATRPSGRIAEADLHDVGRFLNRALGLPPNLQNRYESVQL